MLSVEPYPYVYTTYVKQRWLGKSLLFILTQEFTDYTLEYFQNAIQTGLVQILRKKTLLSNLQDITIKDLDIIIHFVHRHESPVFDIPSVQDSNLYLNNTQIQLVFKPFGMPVHPSSHYNKNSLINQVSGKFVNRLDKLVSGSMFCCPNAETAEQLSLLFSKREIVKFYAAGVENLQNLSGFFAVFNEILDGDQFNERCCKAGKCVLEVQKFEDFAEIKSRNYHSLSVFYVQGSSVLCYPVTGRTHQLRIHLQELGCPIINDPLYGGVKSEILSQIFEIEQNGSSFVFQREIYYELLKEKLGQIKGLRHLNIQDIMDQFSFPELPECWICNNILQQSDEVLIERNGKYNIVNPYKYVQKMIYLSCVFYYINDVEVQGKLPEWFKGDYEEMRKQFMKIVIQK